MTEQSIKLPSSASGWALSIAYTALMGIFTWVMSLDREVSRLSATLHQVIEADKIQRDALLQEISNRREDMQEVRRVTGEIRDAIYRHTESTLNGVKK